MSKLIGQIKHYLKKTNYPWTLDNEIGCIRDSNGNIVIHFNKSNTPYDALAFAIDAPTYIAKLLNIIEELSSNPLIIVSDNVPKPRFTLETNDKWYAYFGESLGESISGVGDSPGEAYYDFLSKWNKKVDMR